LVKLVGSGSRLVNQSQPVALFQELAD